MGCLLETQHVKRRQSRRFLECVEDNFLTQLVSELSKGWTLLDLLFTNRRAGGKCGGQMTSLAQ